MNKLLLKDIMRRNKINSPHIHIYYNRQFPLEDIVDVFYPLFHADYPYDELIDMISSTNHVFCAYDHIQRRCVACALLNNAGSKGGLYIMLFGVRQSSQHHGIGTKLLKTIIHWAHRTGHTFIYLHVHAENFKAIGLYEKVGFRRHEYLPDFYQNTSKKNPAAFRMVLLL
jgi:ribosomal protein S18 acetylase RimI-like enzyme